MRAQERGRVAAQNQPRRLQELAARLTNPPEVTP